MLTVLTRSTKADLRHAREVLQRLASCSDGNKAVVRQQKAVRRQQQNKVRPAQWPHHPVM